MRRRLGLAFSARAPIGTRRRRCCGGSTSGGRPSTAIDPATGTDDTWTAPEYLGTLSVREKGGLVVSMVSGFYFFDPTTGKFEAIVDPEAEIDDSRFNDGKTDRQGRFWSGTMFEAPGKRRRRSARSGGSTRTSRRTR